MSAGNSSADFISIWESQRKGKFGVVDELRESFGETYRMVVRNFPYAVLFSQLRSTFQVVEIYRMLLIVIV